MTDGIIKGTGNSRYLKSNIPEGTTVEQLVAMLRAGTFPIDLNGINADGWQQIGDALNKAHLLDDITCTALGIPTTSSPNYAFLSLAIGAGKYGFDITVKTYGGNPIPGVTITGVTKPNGTAAVTDINGHVLAVATSETPSVSIATGLTDVTDKALTLTSAGVITAVTIAMSRNSTTSVSLSASANYKFSADVKTISATCVGPGGGGGGFCSNLSYWTGGAGGGGGGSGYVVTQSFAYSPNSQIACYVGAGGSAGENNTSGYAYGGSGGGASYITADGVTKISASGGSGGGAGRLQGTTYIGGTGGSGQVNGNNGGVGSTDTDTVYGGNGGSNGSGYGSGGKGGQRSSGGTLQVPAAGYMGHISMSWAF